MLATPLVRAGGAPGRVRHVGVTVNTLVRAGDTGGAWSMLDYVMPAGFAGPVPHVHRETTETFYCAAGRLALTLDGREVLLGPGEAAVVPPGVPHAFRNAADGETRMVVTLMPGGFEAYFDELAALAEASEQWPPADRGAIAGIAARYDLH